MYGSYNFRSQWKLSVFCLLFDAFVLLQEQVLHESSAMLCSVRRWPCLGCRQIAGRCFSSSNRQLQQSRCAEKDFRPKKALLVRKVTRYEYEKFYLKPELSETQLQEYVRIFVVFTAHQHRTLFI